MDLVLKFEDLALKGQVTHALPWFKEHRDKVGMHSSEGEVQRGGGDGLGGPFSRNCCDFV